MKILKTANYIKLNKTKKIAQFDDDYGDTYESYNDDAYEDAYNFADENEDYYDDGSGRDESEIEDNVLDLIDDFSHLGFKALKLVEKKNGWYELWIADNIKGENRSLLDSGRIDEIEKIVQELINKEGNNINNNQYPTDTPMGMEDDNPIEEDYYY